MSALGTLRTVAAAGLTILLITMGCRPADERPTTGSVTILYEADEWVLGPDADDGPKFMVFLPLASFASACRDGAHVGLAERWEHSADYRRWTIYLRRDARWHDDVPVTAHDIEFNIRLWKHPDVARYGAFEVDSVHVVDDHVVTLVLKRSGTYPLQGWDVFYPKHLLEHLEPKDFFAWDFWTRPVGSGPYRYLRHDRGTMMEFEANADFYAGTPAIEQVRLRLSGAPAVTELLSGNVDIASIRPVDAPKLEPDGRFRVYYGGSGQPIRLVWNADHPIFAERRVRRALTLSIDRRALLRVLDLPDDIPVTDGVYSSCQFERRDLPPALPHDPTEAVRLLESAGWHDSDGDGVREREGRPFRFVTIVDRDPRWVQAATFAQAQLRKVGVHMDVQVFEQGVVFPRYTAGDFEAALPRLAQPDSFFRAPSWYGHPRVARILPLLAKTVERQARDRMYEELPATFLFPRVGATAAHRRVRGLEGSVSLFRSVGQLWIRDDHPDE